MRGLWVLVVIAFAARGAAAVDWRDALQRVRENVAQQVKKTTNYTCVETIDRTMYRSARDLLPGCAYESKMPERRQVTHDRLRLDVAVSEGREIFAWHGQEKFSGSTDIEDIVQRGTVSSGGFIGFLGNIFLDAGVRFEFTGEGTINGVHSYSFNYTVPIGISGYHVGTRHGKPLIPFHGSFSVRLPEFQLVSLSIIGDDIPKNSQLCSAETDMTYQMANISGQEALLPALLTLRLDDVNHQYTVSRSEYSACRAYGAESTLHFEVDDSAAAAASGPASEEQLPVGTTLNIALRTPIDDATSFTGDPVAGVLLSPVKLKSARMTIPKNTAVTGVITMLEKLEEPVEHYLVDVQFARLTFQNKRFVFRATPEVSKQQGKKLMDVYHGPWPDSIQELYDNGLFVFRSSHIHLDERFSAVWITQALDAPAVARSGTGAR
jgi:hypothetical protein